MKVEDVSSPDSPNLDRLANLIDHRTEELAVEYKSWMDLSDSEHKSKIAKHLCAWQTMVAAGSFLAWLTMEAMPSLIQET